MSLLSFTTHLKIHFCYTVLLAVFFVLGFLSVLLGMLDEKMKIFNFNEYYVENSIFFIVVTAFLFFINLSAYLSMEIVHID